MKTWFKSGSPWVWLSAGGVSISLISVLGLLWLIASRGLSYFWPADIHQFELTDETGRSSTVIGEIYDRELIPAEQLAHANISLPAGTTNVERLLVKTGNRELVSLDFRWLLMLQITSISRASDGAVSIAWNAKPGKFYLVEYSLDLAPWTELSDSEVSSFTLEAGNVIVDPTTTDRLYLRVAELP